MTIPADLESVFMASRPALGRFLRARLRGERDAEDILQDLWLKISTLETGPIDEPLAYLYRMAENLVRDRHRSATRRSARETDWTKSHIEGSVDAPVDGEPSAERILLARDLLQRVNQALDALPERTAFAFRSVRIDGAPQREIATQMGISVSAVEKHLQKAYRCIFELQHQFDQDCGDLKRLDHEGQDDVRE
jgi:RNA polymerase sigma-70 factor (ECF subfamily)